MLQSSFSVVHVVMESENWLSSCKEISAWSLLALANGNLLTPDWLKVAAANAHSTLEEAIYVYGALCVIKEEDSFLNFTASNILTVNCLLVLSIHHMDYVWEEYLPSC